MRNVFTALIMVLVLMAGWAHAEDPAENPQWLPPLKWYGVYKWRGDDVIQHVSISLTRWSIDDNGIMIARGRGRCKVGNEVTRVMVKVSFNLKTLDFEMWERPIKVDPTYVTDGSHIGKLSADHRTIVAVWTTNGTGEKGYLHLKAYQ